MTVSALIPVNTYKGNSSVKIFDFDFLIENESELIVSLLDMKLNTTTDLVCGIDFSIHEIGNSNGSYINFPLETSSFNVLNENQVIVLSLNLPIKQESEFKNSSTLSLSVLEWSFDYIIRLLQILNRKIERCVKVNEGSDITAEQLVNNIEGLKSSLYQYVEQSASEAEKATKQAQLAKEYAMQVEYGVRWQAFTADNWVSSDDKFTMTLDETSLIILGIYRVIDGIKEKVVNVDVSVAENKVTLTSPEAFTGGFLAASKTQGNYTHQQTLPADEWLISHNLGKYPVVVIADNEGFVQMGTIQYLSLNQVRVTFENEISGFAYLS